MSNHEERRLTRAMEEAGADVAADADRLSACAREQGQSRLGRRMVVRGITASLAIVLLAVGGGALQGWLAGPRVIPAVSLTPAPQFTDDGESPPVQTEDGEVLVSCGHGLGWKASVTDDGLPGVDRAQFVPALETLVTTVGQEAPRELVAAPDLAVGPWRVLALQDGQATVAVGDSGALQVMGMERQDGQWRVRGWGGCTPEPVLASSGLNWVQVSSSNDRVAKQTAQEPTVQPLPRDTRTLQVWVRERGCTSGRDPRPHLREPVLVETTESVTVYWVAEAPTGPLASCPGVTPIPVMLQLPTPLGDRPLLDGSSWPPTPVGGDR